MREHNRLDHVVNININNNQVNDAVNNKLEFDSSNSLSNNPVKDPLPIVTVILRGGKKSRKILNSDLICLWDIGSTDRMIKSNYINTY